jgi:hypothetical protein
MSSKPKGISICPEAIDEMEGRFSELLSNVLIKASEITLSQERKRITFDDIRKGFSVAIESQSNNLLIEQMKHDFDICLRALETKPKKLGGDLNESIKGNYSTEDARSDEAEKSYNAELYASKNKTK